MVWKAALALALAVCSAQPARADNSYDVDTGNQYFSGCERYGERGGNASMWGICVGYLAGFLARHRLQESRIFCIPATATNGQMMDVVIAYLRNNPSVRHHQTSVLMTIALVGAFPCPAPAPARRTP